MGFITILSINYGLTKCKKSIRNRLVKRIMSFERLKKTAIMPLTTSSRINEPAQLETVGAQLFGIYWA